MGKQINYYMNYQSFLQVAQAALDAGCLIIRGDHTDEQPKPSAELSAVAPECDQYFFYLPELADLVYQTDIYGKHYLAYHVFPLNLAVIEAGYSRYPANEARLYVATGYYDKDGQWIPRSERITKVYEKLARKARKVAQKLIR